VPHDDAAERRAWDAALDRYRDLAADIGGFNVDLLERLGPSWQSRVRPDTSMFTVMFTRHGQTGYQYDERVEVEREAPDRVRVTFVRQVPRRGERRPAGPVVVAGDFARPENAGAVVESFLMQLAGD
jgi:hypothetical protein